MNSLMLHHGDSLVSREVLEATETPDGTSTFKPIPHYQLVMTVETALQQSGLRIIQSSHGLTHDAQRYFGLMQITGGERSEGYEWVLGLRNSHDKKFPAAICAGSQIIVCSNLSFIGEVKIARKHTRFVVRDLQYKVWQVVGRLREVFKRQDERIQTYKRFPITDPIVHDLTIRALDSGVITGEKIPKILHEWREPRFDEFKPRTMWGFFNSVTEHLKNNLPMLPRRTESLYQVCDSYIGA